MGFAGFSKIAKSVRPGIASLAARLGVSIRVATRRRFFSTGNTLRRAEGVEAAVRGARRPVSYLRRVNET
jgi:hypothetical protein